jgi:hypothetical protein
MGMSARQGTQDLAATIRALLHPSGEATQEMRAMGLNALDVENNLGKEGLTGTLGELTDAILKNTQGGNVLLGYMNQMSPAAKGLAQEILQGKISTEGLREAVYNLNPEQAKLISLFDTAATSATGLKQTFSGALSTMVGGATGLNTALMLTDSHAKTFADNVKTIGDAARTSGSDVAGWAQYQQQAGVELSETGKAAEAMGDQLGMALLPEVRAVIGPLSSFFGMLARNRGEAIAFAAVIGGVLAGALGAKLAGALKDLKEGISLVIDGIGKIPDVISGIGSMASSVASFASSVAQNLAKAAVATATWIAEHAVATAQFIAQNIAQAASATAAFIAENAATLGIVALIALLIAAIVFLALHWKEVWAEVKAVGLDAWHYLDDQLIHPLMDGVDELVKWVDSHWRLLAVIIATVLLGPVAGLIVFIATHWAEFTRLTAELYDDVTGFFERLPGRIMSFLASLPGDMLNMGENIINGLISGIESKFDSVLSIIGSLGHDVSSIFSSALSIFSPSRVFYQHGINTMLGYINAIRAMAPQVMAAMRSVGGQVAMGGLPGVTSGAGAGGISGAGHVTVNVQANIAPGMAAYNTPAFNQYLQSAVQEAILRWGISNPGTGFVLPGRAT